MRNSKFFVIGLLAMIIALVSGIYIGIEARGGHETREAENTENTPADAAIANFFNELLNDADGHPFDLAQLRGKILVLNFWATWCTPCREEMPEFSRLQTKYAANGVQFVGIALDSADNVSSFVKQYPVTYPLLIAGTRGAEITRQLGNARLALPYSIVFSAKTEVLMTRLGRISEPELDALLQKATAK
ncbi:redoxin family protein [Propionivibrio sp.]|uniref:TlpA family protein disulfide reductase n=1 Tax=Propionivibrio sp. TaxID=2212460 RepID=UPI0025D79D19|nr:redoxin family protein [Propionivibrio sp.]MBK7355065.1 redoxin family protein [Propionivibrio sp.]MBK8402435.1 redoxin family protein [Propionivibrio sp.]MBK8743589.1 redoxin family protein [Propionivibrio sp.]MBK8892893.1 redoxin family protein [Propionivibrio sp.]MBL0206444.1 redoxin family protein [Propionivibrio sp.]